MILAAIDIGSNAARLLIVETSVYHDGTVDYTKLNLLRVPLRLGFDVFDTGSISPEKQRMLLDTLQIYKRLMDLYKVEAYTACATSAMRDASNREEVLETARRETGIEIRIISGQEEAAVLYETHIAESLNEGRSSLYIDVGGGSTEVTLFAKNRIVFKESFNIGTIRLLRDSVAEEAWERMKWFLKTYTQDHQPLQAIGTGGNINKIFSISKRREGRPLPLELLRDYYKELSNASQEERQHRYGFRSDRADVIVPALQIYLSILRWVDAEEIYVPKIGLADGLVKMLYRDRTTRTPAAKN